MLLIGGRRPVERPVDNSHSITPSRIPSLCFLSITRRPPGYPLFPYTTLFRSADGSPEPGWPLSGPFAVGYPALGKLSADRKSTRLNSSHRTISYAVFCLKKK